MQTKSYNTHFKNVTLVKFRIHFKILVLTFQAYHRVDPTHICELIQKHNAVNASELLENPEEMFSGYFYQWMIHEQITVWNCNQNPPSLKG